MLSFITRCHPPMRTNIDDPFTRTTLTTVWLLVILEDQDENENARQTERKDDKDPLAAVTAAAAAEPPLIKPVPPVDIFYRPNITMYARFAYTYMRSCMYEHDLTIRQHDLRRCGLQPSCVAIRKRVVIGDSRAPSDRLVRSCSNSML